MHRYKYKYTHTYIYIMMMMIMHTTSLSDSSITAVMFYHPVFFSSTQFISGYSTYYECYDGSARCQFPRFLPPSLPPPPRRVQAWI